MASTHISFKILIVDDESMILEILAEAFKGRGYDVHLASSGKEAISILKQEKIDLVVSDIRMPNGNGMAILDFVNSMEERPVFLFFTGESELNLNEYLKFGAPKIFTKPFDYDQLISEVEKEFIICIKKKA